MKRDPSVEVAGAEAVSALLVLATEDIPLKDRIAKAWLEHLSKIDPAKLSFDFEKRLRWIHSALDEDALIHDSISKLTPEEASILAQRITDFALALEMSAGAQTI